MAEADRTYAGQAQSERQGELPRLGVVKEEATAAVAGSGARVRGGGVPWVVLALCVGVVAAYAFAVTWYLASVRAPATIAGLRVGGRDVGGVAFSSLEARLADAAGALLDENVVFTVEATRVRATRREAGFVIDTASIAGPARQLGKTGNPAVDLPLRRRALRGEIDLPVAFALDRQRALEFLSDVKEMVDRAPVDAKLDLEKHTVAPERAGLLVEVYESVSLLEDAARAGRSQIPLASLSLPAEVKKESLADIDISTVLGRWETHYSNLAMDSDRTYNLKVGAGKLDGHMLMPHELFSFNRVVGDRTEKEGYRVAPVISGGELIDGLAGGMCQIASTLHAAAFFAGLDIVSATPHSRPSAYIPMGLDSTVVYPTTDLKLRNPFDFPVVMHYSVNQGAVRVELLGKARPYQVVFEREITKETDFRVEPRKDKDAPLGQKWNAQEGYPGYQAVRRRYLFDAATKLPKHLGSPEEPLQAVLTAKNLTPVRVDKWGIHYPATEQIAVVGAGPPSQKKKVPPPSHHIPPVPKDQKPFSRIVR